MNKGFLAIMKSVKARLRVKDFRRHLTTSILIPFPKSEQLPFPEDPRSQVALEVVLYTYHLI